MLARGRKQESLAPLFAKANKNAIRLFSAAPQPNVRPLRDRKFFNQRGKRLDEVPVGVNKLIVMYSRPLNLKNRISVFDIHGRERPASKYLVK
eukprot:scaffold21860_cov54-Cyclotella_meneghiniana.AAC.1